MKESLLRWSSSGAVNLVTLLKIICYAEDRRVAGT